MILKIARSFFVRTIVGFIFTYGSFLLPIRRLYESRQILAFHHPRPSYPWHVLIVPKMRLCGLADLTAAHSSLLIEILAVAADLTAQFDTQRNPPRLVVNAGAYQKVPHLHFHWIAGEPA